MRATQHFIAGFSALAAVHATPLEARGGCEQQPAAASSAPKYTPDTAAAFSAQTSFGSIAAAADVPNGYHQTYSNRNAATILQGMSYLGAAYLQTYDSCACAQRCNALRGCLAINLYWERDPSLNPGPGCTNPASATQIKCAFFGDQARASSATNKGQFREKFQVVIAGSNAYVNKTVATPSGYTDPTYLGKGAIVAPYDSQGFDSYMGIKTFDDGKMFDVARCADYCSSVSSMNLANPSSDGSPAQTCQFFNTYMQSVNKLSNRQVQQCQIYSESWPASYATNKGQYIGSDRLLVDYSFSFSNTNPGGPNKQGAIYQAKREIINNSLQPYCSAVLNYSIPASAVAATSTTSIIVTSTSTTYTIATTNVLTTSITTVPTTEVATSFTTTTTTPSAAADITFRRREAGNVAGRADAAPSTPSVLTKYPATVVSSACSLVETPAATTAPSAAGTVAVTRLSTTVVPTTSTSTLTSFSTLSSTASTTISTTTTTTVTETAPTCPAPTSASFVRIADYGCGCTYASSCGKYPNFEANCAPYASFVPDFVSCASYCDTQGGTCKSFILQRDGLRTCYLCNNNIPGGTLADGDGGYVLGTREPGSCGPGSDQNRASCSGQK